MKIQIVAFLLLFPFMVLAQSGPRFVSLDGADIDVGSHVRGQEVHYPIHFKNAGDSDLYVFSATTSCGCSTALSSIDTLKPGEEGIINFTFNGNGFGKVTKAVNVTTNETPTNVHTLLMNMNMVDPVTVNPQSIIADAKVGDELQQTATLTNSFDKTLDITEVSSNSPAVKASADKTSLSQGEMSTVNISIKIYEESDVNAAVIIKTSQGDFQIPILITVKK